MQRRHRLRGTGNFQALQADGRRWRHPLVILLARPNQLTYSRFGFVASRRVGNAVVRNRVRRRLREAVRSRVDAIVPGWDCLFIARTNTPDVPYADIEEAVEQLLMRAALWPAPVSGALAAGE